MAATFLIIGLGRFGTSLALRLAESGNEVMVVDTDEQLVSRIAPHVTQAKIGDAMDEELLQSLGVENFDCCFVCIGEQFQTTLEITSLLKEMGAPRVIAKADRDLHARLLRKIGADEVIFPERDMAQRTAMRFSVNGALEYMELAPEYGIFELEIPPSWQGKSLLELNVRSRWKVNIIGCKESGTIRPIADAQHRFRRGDHIVATGTPQAVQKMMEQKK